MHNPVSRLIYRQEPGPRASNLSSPQTWDSIAQGHSNDSSHVVHRLCRPISLNLSVGGGNSFPGAQWLCFWWATDSRPVAGRADSGLTAVTAIMLEGAVIQAVDPLAQKTGVSAKTHEVLIMDGLSPGAHMSLRKDVRADGLTFEQRMVAGDLVLDVHPTGGI